VTSSSQIVLEKRLRFLDKLEDAKISYRLDHIRDSVLVELAVPGERWEVEFFPDGHVETERFRGTGTVDRDASVLDTLFTEDASALDKGGSRGVDGSPRN
jgi:hypothetical protein